MDKTCWTEPLGSVRWHLEFESGPRRARLRQSEEETRIARGMGRSGGLRRADGDAADYGRCLHTGQRGGPGRARSRSQPSGPMREGSKKGAGFTFQALTNLIKVNPAPFKMFSVLSVADCFDRTFNPRPVPPARREADHRLDGILHPRAARRPAARPGSIRLAWLPRLSPQCR